ncbi:hypothetical protein J8Y17_27420 (plasmid) [Bacillus cereus]|uniref:hypothetical protein n=1 Tax=Bacillus TaxID=1386 RepID=UPI0015524F89|nr:MULTISPECIES: hypothetical protein [Bacillus]MDA2074434.1 hypothetical protein [Bacillus cereus]QUW34415.1 hypothetical protein J8Y17_27420 [Bacillus cereus]
MELKSKKLEVLTEKEAEKIDGGKRGRWSSDWKDGTVGYEAGCSIASWLYNKKLCQGDI